MKRKIASTLLAVMMLLSLPALAQETAGGMETGVIINGPIEVYDGLWENAKIAGTLQTGTPVIVTQQFGDMLQVFSRVDRVVGWLNQMYVQLDRNTPVIYPGIVISQNVSLRESPSTGARRIASIPNGSVFDLLDEQNGWYYVRYWDSKNSASLEGWVLVDYVVRDPSFITTTQSTYVYATPSRSAKKVGQLSTGTQLVVIGEWDDFWVVNLRSASGFIYKRDVEENFITGGNG